MDKQFLKRTAMGGLVENPTFVLVIGTCPLIAMSVTIINSLFLGIATMLVLVFSNIIISLLRKLIPDEVRLPAYVIIIAALVTVVDLFMQKYMSGFYATAEQFIGLIAVNCIILARAEAFAGKNGVLFSAVDGLSIGFGFIGSICLMGGIRQLLGEVLKIGIFSQPAGGFIVFGLLLAMFNSVVYHIKRYIRKRNRNLLMGVA